MIKQSMQKVGIWGFGVVGQAVARFFQDQPNLEILVYDQNCLAADFTQSAAKLNFYADLDLFLTDCDYIIPSPGVNLVNYHKYRSKFKTELDLFAQYWSHPIIAITGTLGKTTLTTLLTQVLQQVGIRALAGGNIGVPMLDLIGQSIDLAVLELSSFQLEQAQNFRPDLAIWTNFYANHLDRHMTLQNYFKAKAQIFLNQTKDQIALLPIEIIDYLINFDLKISSKLYFFGEQAALTDFRKTYLSQYGKGFFTFNQAAQVVLQVADQVYMISELDCFEQVNTYRVNLLILQAVCYLQKLALPKQISFRGVEHRNEHFLSQHGIDWYNDSKSTVPEATTAALAKLAGRPVILFLGGVSKGVDRLSWVASLKNQVKAVLCFGSEAQALDQACQKAGINSRPFHDLSGALDYCLKIAEPHDQVLFSPAGASFDLFKNYVERGQFFKQQVKIATGVLVE